MDHLEAIVEIKNVVSTEFIDKIIPLINHKAKKNLEVMGGLDKNIRNVKGYSLTFDTPTDHYTTTARHLSIIINLNDEYEGGDLIFTDQKEKEIKRLKLGKGSIVFFPSNFMYPHSIQPITKGTRYSIVAWLQ
jgi:predicted 2-oxoglutarate/Fe(II)-dependent dioxygenase YbiX